MIQNETIALITARCNLCPTIVRCKECKYRYGDKDEPYCSRINPYSGICVEDEDFCSWGEKDDV